MTGPRFTPLVENLPASVPFVGPETQERRLGRTFAARLGANESVFGPSPKAIEAMAQAARDTWMYGDPEAHDLRAAIAAHHGVTPEHVMPGEGIDGLLGLLVRLTVGPGDAVVTSDGAYPTFNFHVVGFGGQLHKVPYRDDREDPKALIARAEELRPRLIYFANPDNPMASHHPAPVVHAMVEAVPEGSLLILDEAYIDLAPEGTAPRIDADDPRVIRMRTFSKGYGLAGLRVGYALGSGADRVLRQGAQPLRSGAHCAGRRPGRPGRSGLAGPCPGRGRNGQEPDCRDRPGERAAPSAFGHQLRDCRLWAGRRICAGRTGRADRPRRVRPHARRCTHGPLHPHQLRHGGGS
jgi:aspartate/methionine/tyrosine aminotransferase